MYTLTEPYASPLSYLRNRDEHPIYMYGYFTALYLLTHAALPFTCIASLNVYAAIHIIRMRAMRRQLTRQASHCNPPIRCAIVPED